MKSQYQPTTVYNEKSTCLSKLSPYFGEAHLIKVLAYQNDQLTKLVSNQNIITVKSYAKISRVKWSKSEMIIKTCAGKISIFHGLTK